MNTYNTYDFNSDVKFIPGKCCDINIDTNLIKNTIKETISGSIENTMEETKNDIIEAVKDNKCCECNSITKEDLKEAVHCINHNTIEQIHCINHHIDEHLNGVNFKCEFENLNNQIKKLQKL